MVYSMQLLCLHRSAKRLHKWLLGFPAFQCMCLALVVCSTLSNGILWKQHGNAALPMCLPQSILLDRILSSCFLIRFRSSIWGQKDPRPGSDFLPSSKFNHFWPMESHDVPSIQNVGVIKGQIHHLQIREATKLKNRRERPWDGAEMSLTSWASPSGTSDSEQDALRVRRDWKMSVRVPMSHSHKLLRTVRLGRLWTVKFKMHCMGASMMTLALWWAMLAVVSGMSHILPQPHHLPYWMADVFSSDLGFRTDT